MTNSGVLLVQNDLKKIVSFAEKCINAGVNEEDIYATVYAEDITRFLKTKGISTIIIDSEQYNLDSATVIKNFSQESHLQLLLVTPNKMKKTLRMLMDKNIKYINSEINSIDLAKVLGYYEPFNLKKVVHM